MLRLIENNKKDHENAPAICSYSRGIFTVQLSFVKMKSTKNLLTFKLIINLCEDIVKMVL